MFLELTCVLQSRIEPYVIHHKESHKVGVLSHSLAMAASASTDDGTIVDLSSLDACKYDEDENASQRSDRSIFDGLYRCFQPFLHLLSHRAGSTTSKRDETDEWEIKFDDIRELKWVGSGAQGVVFFGVYEGDQVAVKKVRHEKETDIKHLRNLKHPNIVAFR